jgi:hypothetical protein
MTETQTPTVIPTINCSGFAVTLSPNECVLSIVQTRVLLAKAENGSQSPFISGEITSAITMPPTVAAQLLRSLAEAIRLYEEAFGKIPEDPQALMSVNKFRDTSNYGG